MYYYTNKYGFTKCKYEFDFSSPYITELYIELQLTNPELYKKIVTNQSPEFLRYLEVLGKLLIITK